MLREKNYHPLRKPKEKTAICSLPDSFVIRMNKGAVINYLLLHCHKFISWHGAELVEYRSFNLLIESFQRFSNTRKHQLRYIHIQTFSLNMDLSSDRSMSLSQAELCSGSWRTSGRFFCCLKHTYSVWLPHNSCVFKKQFSWFKGEAMTRQTHTPQGTIPHTPTRDDNYCGVPP